MVPVLAPAAVFPDPVPAELAARVRYRPAPAIEVRNTQDVYLQQTELTRAQYEAAVRGFLALDEADRGEWDSLVHSADPLGAERLTRDGLVPAVHRGGEAAWLAQLRAGDRPVTGIDFFQAYTVARMAGACTSTVPLAWAIGGWRSSTCRGRRLSRWPTKTARSRSLSTVRSTTTAAYAMS